jgi:hypothetical protein
MRIENLWGKAGLRALAVGAAMAIGSTAGAATISTNGISGSFDCSGIGQLPAGQIDVFAGAQFGADFEAGDEAGAFCFDVNNNSDTATTVVLSVVTINQKGTFWGFDGGVTLGNQLVNASWDEGEFAAEEFTFVLGPNESTFFDFEYGTPYFSQSAGPSIDFAIAAVPLPAGLLLLGGALGALGLVRRRNKTA